MSTSTASQPSKDLVVRISEDLHAEVKERSQREERTVSQTIRLALRQYLQTPPTIA